MKARSRSRRPPRVDELQYIRDYYAVPAYRGVKVNAYGKEGVITGGDGSYVMIRLEGNAFSRPYHPTDGITYKIEGGHKP
jgi:hypothetical protein